MYEKLLETLHRMDDGARPGPWVVRNDNEGTSGLPFWVISQETDEEGEWFAELHVGDYETAKFIAMTRQIIPQVIAGLNDMQTELEQARKERDAAIKDIPHKCWSCANGFYTDNGFDCDLTHYKSGCKDCLSWQWRGVKGDEDV